jgi:hypothetical protein
MQHYSRRDDTLRRIHATNLKSVPIQTMKERARNRHPQPSGSHFSTQWLLPGGLRPVQSSFHGAILP